jgi:hypothetical protein
VCSCGDTILGGVAQERVKGNKLIRISREDSSFSVKRRRDVITRTKIKIKR